MTMKHKMLRSENNDHYIYSQSENNSENGKVVNKLGSFL